MAFLYLTVLLGVWASAAAQSWQPTVGTVESASDMSTAGASWMPSGSFGAAQLENYAQCGGIGGSCTLAPGTCVDAAWPAASCKQGAKCVRNTAYHWMCKPASGLVAGPLTSGTTDPTERKGTTAKEPGFQSDNAARDSVKEESGNMIPGTDVEVQKVVVEANPIIERWKQCGGTGARCKLYGEGACRDCPFPGTECETDYVCSKIMNGYWQCAPADKYKAGVCPEDEEATADDLDMGAEEDMAPAPAPEEELPEGLALGATESTSDAGEWTSSTATTAAATPAAAPKAAPTPSKTAPTPTKRGSCGAPAVSTEVDGTYLSGVFLKSESRRLYYAECCQACQAEVDCKAFQVNIFQANASTCDFFSQYNELVPGSTTSISGVIAETNFAG